MPYCWFFRQHQRYLPMLSVKACCFRPWLGTHHFENRKLFIVVLIIYPITEKRKQSNDTFTKSNISGIISHRHDPGSRHASYQLQLPLDASPNFLLIHSLRTHDSRVLSHRILQSSNLQKKKICCTPHRRYRRHTVC